MNKVIVILGPTASGKSDLAVSLAKSFNGEVISADSRQVYKGMNIGTGKITKKEMKRIPHHLLDITSPKRQFTVSQYKNLARRKIKNILQKGKLPILCGGTGFYIQAVVDGIIIPKVKPDLKLRKKLEKLETKELFKKLKSLDPKRAEVIDKQNRRRLIRALEILIKTKKPIPVLKKEPLPYPVLMIGLLKKNLNEVIEKRYFEWLEKGFLKEVKKLRQSGISIKRIKDFGLHYKTAAEYLKDEISYREMTDRSLRELKSYAKRQTTWWKADKRINWIKTEKQAERLVKNFLK